MEQRTIQDFKLCACGCGKSISKSKKFPYTWNTYINGHNQIGIKRSQKTLKRLTKSHPGESNHNWKGGISYKYYPRKFNNRLREKIRKRDNNICQVCGRIKEPNGYRLSVHHIDYSTKNNNPKNLITLCHSCNRGASIHKKVWIKIFTRIIKKIYRRAS